MVLELCKNYRNPDDLVNGLDFAKFARVQLLNTIELKKNGNYSGNNLNKAETDPKWLAFLDNIEKGEPVKVEQRENNYDSRRAYAMPKAAGVIATWFMMKNKDMDLFMHDFFKEMYALLTKFTDKQKKRLNENLLENGIEPLSEEGFDELRLAFYEKALDMELPF